jgi:hypothetical protein
MKPLLPLALAFLHASEILAQSFIQCENFQLEASGDEQDVYGIPIHQFSYSFDGGQTFLCNQNFGQDGQCAQATDDSTYYQCNGNKGGSESAAFWITLDGCFNVESGGNHMYCCGANVGSDAYGTWSCQTSGYGPS